MDKLEEALKIAKSTPDQIKELDFGNVFWACGVLAAHLSALKAQPPVKVTVTEGKIDPDKVPCCHVLADDNPVCIKCGENTAPVKEGE
jgi:hypothetical protein